MKSLFSRVAAASMLCFAAPAFADDTQPDFTLINHTGSSVDGVFISVPGASVSTKNELTAALADGAVINLKYSSADKRCVLDVKVTWDNGGKSEVINNADLCKIDKLTVTFDKTSGKASYVAE